MREHDRAPDPTEDAPDPAPAEVVGDTLREYAERGVFRGFDEREDPGAVRGEGVDEGVVSSFHFFWLGPRPFHITLDSAGETLTARGLLPSVDAHPAVREDLERLIEERAGGSEADGRDAGLPPHRRIDPEKATAALVSRQEEPDSAEHLDLVFTVRSGHHEYAVRKLLNLINEIWVRLQDRHQRYMWEELQAPME